MKSSHRMLNIIENFYPTATESIVPLLQKITNPVSSWWQKHRHWHNNDNPPIDWEALLKAAWQKSHSQCCIKSPWYIINTLLWICFWQLPTLKGSNSNQLTANQWNQNNQKVEEDCRCYISPGSECLDPAIGGSLEYFLQQTFLSNLHDRYLDR